jgi:hypothetical protein
VREAIPACSIDWTRLHSLAVAVPPESLSDADRLVYVQGIRAGADIPLSTFGRYNSTAPDSRAVRTTVTGHVLPADSTATSTAGTLPAAANGVVATGAFTPAAPDAGTRAQVETQLQRKVPFDATSRSFSPVPMPFRDLDAVRCFFPTQAAPPFADTLELDDPGVQAGDTTLPALLLETRMDGATRFLGELDRLLLRAPVAGRFRFEPYYVYTQPDATTFTPVGPSTSGRLIVQQPALGTAEKLEKTDTQVFKARAFAFEHVDRASVAQLAHRVVMLQLAFAKETVRAHKGETGAEARLAIPKSSPEVLGWVLDAVNGTLRAWTAFLSVLAWRPEDATVKSALPAAWFAGFDSKPMRASDAKSLTDAIDQIKADEDWLASLLFFSENVLAPRLAGYTWSEVLTRNGQDPDTRRFPVTKDKPPFTPADAAVAKQHARLRLLEDPKWRWLPCFAGCAIGRPSRVYAPAAPPAGTRVHPANAITTYELEVLHTAGSAHTALGLGAQPAGAAPAPGVAMDLAPYAAQAIGHGCTFTAERSAADRLHTTVDWLVELTRGVHARRVDEDGFVDLLALRDPATGEGNPLLGALRADEADRARHLRRQADALETNGLGPRLVTWWDGQLNFATAGDQWHFDSRDMAKAPKDPYGSGDTNGMGKTLFTFDDLVFLTPPSGFDGFDLESASQAAERMTKPLGTSPLPVAVVLTLMETEGVKLFAPINRRTRNTTSAAAAVRWEGRRRAGSPGPRARSDFGPNNSDIARRTWLGYPYGLDTYAAHLTPTAMDARVKATAVDSDVIALDAGESIGRYISDRVYADWEVLPPASATGVPTIWKRSRRAHWAAISLMVAYYRHIETEVHRPSTDNDFQATDGFKPDLTKWFPAGSSPPSLVGVTPNDAAWKDYLTYYAVLYLGHNGGPTLLREAMRGVESNIPGATALTHRDWFVARHLRSRDYMGNVARFIIGLDAFLRLDYMAGATPGDYATAAPDTTDPAGRAWGLKVP